MNIGLLNTFWYWMSERHRIYLKRQQGDVWPWTSDPILGEYKFTNVYRQLDRVTQEWTVRKERLKRLSAPALLTHLLTFRMFNLPSTYDHLLVAGVLHTNDGSFNLRRAKTVLKTMTAKKMQVFTGAYIITNSGQSRPKIELVSEAIAAMVKDADHIVSTIRAEKTMQFAVSKISEYPLVGQFIGYELVCDMRFTPILKDATDVLTWANPGPGAQRGLNRIFRGDSRDRPKSNSTAIYLNEMRMLYKMACHGGKMDAQVLESPWPFELREIEHSLCEFDKYVRVRNGEGRPRSKYRPPKGE